MWITRLMPSQVSRPGPTPTGPVVCAAGWEPGESPGRDVFGVGPAAAPS